MAKHLVCCPLAVILCILCYSSGFAWGCPTSQCTCVTVTRRKVIGKNVVCSMPWNKLTDINQLLLSSMPNDTIYLNLTQNEISRLKAGSFSSFRNLQKLDLSGNKISVIEPDAFRGLDNLTKLDLSNNKIEGINSSHFEGLPKLQRLSLSGNLIHSIPNGTFNNLTNLKKIDFNTSRLTCDCKLSWVIPWKDKHNIAINKKTRCAFPESLSGKILRDMSEDELHCRRAISLSVFKLIPEKSQVVFEGDKLPFECRASVGDDPSAKMFWVRKNVPVEEDPESGIIINEQRTPERRFLTIRLVINHLNIGHNGIWTCRVVTDKGRKDTSVNIIVLSKETKFCPAFSTPTNRGDYHWPKTVSNIRVDLPCSEDTYHPEGDRNIMRKAYHRCSKEGQWEKLNVSECQFSNEVTRVLMEFYGNLKKDGKEGGNITEPTGALLNINKYLNPETTTLPDVDSVNFLASIIQYSARHTHDKLEIAQTTIEFASIMMNANDQYLREAQRQYQSCSRVVKALESLPRQLMKKHTSFDISTKNIAMEAKQFEASSFTGATCSAYNSSQNPSFGYRRGNFFCSWRMNSTVPDKHKQLEASITLPPTLFRNTRCLFSTCSKPQLFKLVITGYKNSKLFPIVHKDRHPTVREVATPVIAAKIVGVTAENLTDPLELHMISRHKGTDRTAVYWQFDTNDDLGGWRESGCSIISQSGNLSIIRCNHMTNFGVIQKPWLPGSDTLPWYRILALAFKMEPVVYVGSVALFICLIPVVVSLCSCHRYVKMPRRQKHSLANLCISMILLTLAFVLGIHRTDNERVCQIAGIAIHYFSLCCVFWITITASNMYKKFTKPNAPPSPPPELLQGPLPPCPMLRYYLLGWGIAIIICGITAAVNLNHYVNSDFCFLAWEPSLGAFIGPVGLLVAINFIIFCCIAYVVKGKQQRSDDPETEEINETELTAQDIESIPRTNGDSVSIDSSVVDLEYRPVSQLRAVAVILFLYLIMWSAAALAVAKPFSAYVLEQYQEMIFSYAYGIMAATLGLFILVFYCLARTDVRLMWRQCCSCRKKQQYTPNTASEPSLPRANGHLVQSTGSLDSAYTNRSNRSNNTNRSSNYRYKTQASSNVNLVPSQPASITGASLTSSIPEYPSFYNPRQNGVAKKYWEKSRHSHKHFRHLPLHNKDLHIHSDNSDSHLSSDLRKHRRSYGNSSNENANMGLTVQVDQHHIPRESLIPNGRPSIGEGHNGYSSLGRSSCPRHSPVPNNPGQAIPLSPIASVNSDSGQIAYIPSQYPGMVMPDPRMAHIHNHHVPFDPITGLPQTQMPPPGFVYPMPVTSVRSNNTLPKVARIQTLSSSNNGSIPHLRELDGQSQASQDSKPKQSRKRSSGSSLQHARESGSSRPTSPETDSGIPYFEPKSKDPRSYGEPIPELRGLTKVQEEGEVDHFLEQLEQRIPSVNKLQQPAPSYLNTEHINGYSESTGGGSQSDTSIGHRDQKLRDLRQYKETAQNNNHNNKCREKSPTIPYAYVNHEYQEKVLQNFPGSGSDAVSDVDESKDPVLKELLPRSSSDHGNTAGQSEESGDEHDERVWVLQQKNKEKNKETRV